jgi:hypothetical protein
MPENLLFFHLKSRQRPSKTVTKEFLNEALKSTDVQNGNVKRVQGRESFDVTLQPVSNESQTTPPFTSESGL